MRCRVRTCFTLLEVLATLVLIAIVMPVALKAISLATTAGGLARHNAQAVSLAETKLHELVLLQNWATGSQSGDFGDEWPDYRWRSEMVSRDADLLEMSVQVVWTWRDGERSVTLSTLLYTGTVQ